MSDTFKLLDQCKLKVKQNNQKPLKHLWNTIYVINYSTDILKKLKNFKYGKVIGANMTLDTQYDFMKCQASFDESYKSVRLTMRAAFSTHCVLPQCNLVAEQIVSMLSLTPATSTPAVE